MIFPVKLLRYFILWPIYEVVNEYLPYIVLSFIVVEPSGDQGIQDTVQIQQGGSSQVVYPSSQYVDSGSDSLYTASNGQM